MSNVFQEVEHSFPEIVGNYQLPNGSKDAINLYLMRHTTTDLDAQDKTHGWIDEPLNEQGIKEAQTMANRFKGVKLDSLHTSDLVRARQAAYAVASVTGTNPQQTSDLRPLDMGNYAGMKHEEVHEKLKSLFEKWKTDPDAKIPGGEGFSTFQQRNLSFLNSVMSGEAGKNVGIMGHSMTMRLFEEYAEHGAAALKGKDIKDVVAEGSLPKVKLLKYANGKFK